MFNSIYLKTLRDLRWQLIGWSLAIIGVVYLTMVLYPSFSQNGIENIINSVPDSLKSFIGNVDDFKTIPGFIGQQIFGPNLYIVSLFMSILIYLSISANEESDGRLQNLLTFPVSRTSVYFQKYLAASTIVILASSSAALGLWLGLVSINETADLARLWQSVGCFALINLAYGALVFGAAFFSGNRSLTVVIASAYTAASLLVTSLAPAVKNLDTISKGSLLHYYNNPQIMTNGIDGAHVVVLLTFITMAVFVGWFGFSRRNVYTN